MTNRGYARLYYEYYRLVCIYTARTLSCSKRLCQSIMAFKAIMDQSIMAFFKKNEDYLKISKIS
jgi:hypothetical protein